MVRLTGLNFTFISLVFFLGFSGEQEGKKKYREKKRNIGIFLRFSLFSYFTSLGRTTLGMERRSHGRVM